MKGENKGFETRDPWVGTWASPMRLRIQFLHLGWGVGDAAFPESSILMNEAAVAPEWQISATVIGAPGLQHPIVAEQPP